MPVRGSRRALLREVRLVDFYGMRNWEIDYVTEEAPGEIRHARIGTESMYDNPRAGDTVLIILINNKPSAVYQTD